MTMLVDKDAIVPVVFEQLTLLKAARPADAVRQLHEIINFVLFLRLANSLSDEDRQ